MKTIKINKLFITVICFVFYFPTYSQNENFRNLAMSMLQYEVCMPFNDGVAPVLYDGRWGLIDTCGNEIFPCVLDFGIVQNYAKGVFVGLRMYNGDSGTKKIYITDYTNLIDKEGNVSTKNSYEEANMLPKYNDLKVRYNKITKTYCTRKGLRRTKGFPIWNEESNYYWIVKGKTTYPTQTGYFCELRDRKFKKINFANQYVYEVDTNRKQSSFSGDWAYIRKSFDDKKQKYFNVRENTVIESGIVKYPNGSVDTVVGATKPKSVWIEEDFKSDVVTIYKEDLEGIERICNITYFLFGKEYIEIPESVKLIEGGWCGKVKMEEEEVALKKIVVFWQEPENIEVCPGLYYKNIILEVPKGTKEKYMNLKPWADCVIVEREK